MSEIIIILRPEKEKYVEIDSLFLMKCFNQ